MLAAANYYFNPSPDHCRARDDTVRGGGPRVTVTFSPVHPRKSKISRRLSANVTGDSAVVVYNIIRTRGTRSAADARGDRLLFGSYRPYLRPRMVRKTFFLFLKKRHAQLDNNDKSLVSKNNFERNSMVFFLVFFFFIDFRGLLKAAEKYTVPKLHQVKYYVVKTDPIGYWYIFLFYEWHVKLNTLCSKTINIHLACLLYFRFCISRHIYMQIAWLKPT